MHFWKDFLTAVLIAVPSSAGQETSRPPTLPAPVSAPAGATSPDSPKDDGYGQRESSANTPERFQRDWSARISTVSSQQVMDARCGKSPNPGYYRAGCARGTMADPLLTLPNPCMPQFKGENFAWRLCHELGHAQGWGADHER